MKKLMVFIFIIMVGINISCSAYGDGKVLTNLQKSSEIIVGMFGRKDSATVKDINKIVSSDIGVFDEKNFVLIQKIVDAKYGELRESKFLAFFRNEKDDRIVYKGNFAKKNDVGIYFIFDKAGKIINFDFQSAEDENSLMTIVSKLMKKQ